MGLCTSRSTVSLAPSAHALGHMGEQDSESGTPTWDERLSVVQSKVLKAAEAGGARSGGPNPPAKGYLELGSKGEAEPQMCREPEEEDDTEGEGDVEELLNFSDSEGSLRSELLE